MVRLAQVVKDMEQFLDKPKSTREFKDHLMNKFGFKELYISIQLVPKLKQHGLIIYNENSTWKAKLNNHAKKNVK